MKRYSVIKDFTDAVWGWFCSDSTFKTADREKPTIFILLGSIREPLYFFFFFKVLSPATAKQMLGLGHQKDLGWQQGGESGVSGNRNSRLSGFTAGKSRLRFLSLVQKERPQERPAACRLRQGHTNRAVFLLGWVETEAGREACSGLLGVQGTTRAGGR